MRVAAAVVSVLAAVALPSAVAHAQAIGASPTGPEGIPSFGATEGRRVQTLEPDFLRVPRGVRARARAPSLPDPLHTVAELSAEQTIAGIETREGGARVTSYLWQFDTEIPVVDHVYAGAQWGFSAARAADASRNEFVAQQPMLFARAAHGFARDRYAVGAGLGVLPPIFAHDDRDDRVRLQEQTAASLASIVQPWLLTSFLDRRVTVRPWIDLRAESRRFVLQVRQALDTTIRTGTPTCTTGDCPSAGDLQLFSISTLYLGWKPTREVSVGVEAWEVYLLQTSLPITDRDRAAFALSPAVRFFYRWVEPSVSVILPVGPPLLGAAESYVALRVDLRVWLGGR